MRTEWDGNKVEVSARSVAGDGRPGGMPEYVRLDLRAWPLDINTIMTPAAAKELAREIYAAACELDAGPELIAFELKAAA